MISVYDIFSVSVLKKRVCHISPEFLVVVNIKIVSHFLIHSVAVKVIL